MAEEELDELFRRFVQKRDVGAVGELFDSAAPQLARIAWHLTHDANGVEDLVQATFLTALASVREFDVERRVMPWLLGILVNHARSARRAAARKPEVLAADVVDRRSPEAELERREVREVVERAVAELPETYRDVVASWLIEGATPSEIAQRTGKPAVTVRVQLRRGLELLRNGLPAGVAGLLATNAWSASSFAASREIVLAQAARIARTLAPTSAVVAGGLLVTSKWLLVAAAALVTAAGVGWFAQRDGAQPATVATAPVVNANELQVSAPITAAEAEERNEVAAPPTSNERETVATLAPGWWLVGDIEGATASDRAHLTSPTGNNWNAEVAGSHFEVEVPAIFEAFRAGSRGANSFTVRYDSPRFMPTHVQVSVPEQVNLDAAYINERVELYMQLAPQPARLVVTGRVTAPITFGVSRTVVALCALDARGRLVNSPTEEVRCSDDGSFCVRSSIDGAHVLAAVLPGLRPATCAIAAESTGAVDLGVITLESGEHLAGSTSISAGDITLIASMVEVHQSLTLESLARPSRGVIDHVRLVWVGDRFEWDKLSLAVDAGGAFRFDGLAPVAYRIGEGIGGTLGSATEVARLTYMNDDDGPTFTASCDSITLANSRRTIRIDVRADGASIDGAAVVLTFGADGGMQSVIRGHLADIVWSGEQSASVRVMKDGWASSELVVTAAEAVPGATRVIELVRKTGLTSLALHPRITCLNDAGSYVVQLIPLDNHPEASLEPFPNKTFSLAESEWRFDDVTPGRYRIDIQATGSKPDTSWCLVPRSEVELAPGESVVRELSFVSGGRLALTILGTHAIAANIKLSGDIPQLSWTYFDPTKGERPYGTSTGNRLNVPIGTRVEFLTVLEAGSHTLTIVLNNPERSQRERTIDIVPGQTTELVVDFSKADER